MRVKPYPRYRSSGVEWLGDVPKHWNVKRLKYSTSINDEVLPETTEPSFRMRYVDIGGIDINRGIVSSEDLDFEDAPSRARRVVRDGDTIVSTVRTYLKAIAAIRKPNANTIVSTGFAVVRPRGVSPDFLPYVLRESGLVDAIVARSVGVSYPAINASEIGMLPIPLPPGEEQSAIARFLDRETAGMDTLIEKKCSLIDRLKEKRASLISQTVTRGLPHDVARSFGLGPHTKLKPSGIDWLGKVPAHWRVVPLKSISKIGNGSTPNRDNVAYWDEGTYPWLNSSVANQEAVTRAEEFVTSLALAECHLPRIRPPAILVGITGQGRTRGMATTLLCEATINQHLAFVKPNEIWAEAGFLRRVFDMAYQYLRNESDGGGSTKGAITCDQIADLRVPLPAVSEQRAIADFLERETGKIDKMIVKIKTAIERLQEYRAALITAAVTGKIDVRGAIA